MLVCCVLCVLVWCGVVVCGGVGVCGVARRKNLRVWIQNVPVCTGTTPACVKTCGRGVGTHGDVLNPHTEVFSACHTGEVGGEEEEKGVTVSYAYHEWST